MPIPMPPAWPRNIVAYDEEVLRTLSSLPNLALYHAALDAPLDRARLAPEEQRAAEALLRVGLLREAGGALVPGPRHLRDADLDAPGRGEYRRALVALAGGAIEKTDAALDAQGAQATAAFAVITLPNDPAILSRAATILAEAEDQMRAVAEEAGREGPRRLQALFFIGSRPERE